jgi:hypothetical protein
VLSDLRRYGRFAVRLRDALQHPITLEDARATIRRRMAEREARFVQAIEVGVFQYPRSPYLPLLRRAGCELGDIRATVRARGLEPTLHALRDAGVYVTLGEFKGRTPIVRNGLTIPVTARDFDNPTLAADFHGQTGGTTGPSTRVGVSLENLIVQTPAFVVAYDAHGVLGAPIALWRGVLPDGTGINHLLRSGAFTGSVPKKWFTPPVRRRRRWRPAPLFMTGFIVGVGRLSGVRLPWPEPVGLDQGSIVARWAAEAAAAHGACLIRANASMSLRIAIGAKEAGVSLRGVTLMGGGEPPTPAKVKQITDAGASWVPTYSFSEANTVALGCAHPDGVDDVHLFKDLSALIQATARVPGTDRDVPAFYFSSLDVSAPKILLNAEIGDYGIVESRACGCPLEACGFTEHLRQIRSFGLITSEGMTWGVADLVRVLEEVLPARFGGSALDYQMVEEEDAAGFTRLVLIVSPKITLADEADVVRTVIDNVGGSARSIWAQAGTIRVRREEPATTARGKLRPLQPAHTRGQSGSNSAG